MVGEHLTKICSHPFPILPSANELRNALQFARNTNLVVVRDSHLSQDERAAVFAERAAVREYNEREHAAVREKLERAAVRERKVRSAVLSWSPPLEYL